MTYYFEIQYRRLSRQLIEFGLQPIIGIPIAFILFISLSVLLFNRTEYAVYIYSAFPIFYLTKLSQRRRISFLKLTYKKEEFWKLRFMENLTISILFIIFLLYKAEYVAAALLLTLSLLLNYVHFSSPQNLIIPTPFRHRPFEFIRGFRFTYWALGFIYFVLVMAVTVGNFNLGLFALAMIYVVCLGFYSYQEPFYFVWMYSSSAKQFLLTKIETSIRYSLILALPAILTMLYFFPNNPFLILAVPMVGMLYLSVVIVTKYSAYPKELNIGQAFVLAISLVMTPLAVISFIYHWPKSVKNISALND